MSDIMFQFSNLHITRTHVCYKTKEQPLHSVSQRIFTELPLIVNQPVKNNTEYGGQFKCSPGSHTHTLAPITALIEFYGPVVNLRHIWHPFPHIMPIGLWSKVLHYIGNKVPFRIGQSVEGIIARADQNEKNMNARRICSGVRSLGYIGEEEQGH